MQDHALVKERRPPLRLELPQQTWVPSARPFSPQAMPGLDAKTKAHLLKGPSLKQAGLGLQPNAAQSSENSSPTLTDQGGNHASQADSSQTPSPGEEEAQEAGEDSDPDDL
jgi:hypothetical protein